MNLYDKGMVFIFPDYVKYLIIARTRIGVQTYFIKVLFELLFYFLYTSVQYFFAFIHKYYLVADLFNLLHAVGTENNGSAIFCQFIDLLFDDIAVNRIQSTERFIQDDQFGIMKNSCYKLELLRHTLGKVFHFFIPPALHFQLYKPFLDQA